jgi:hypothetical protein
MASPFECALLFAIIKDAAVSLMSDEALSWRPEVGREDESLEKGIEGHTTGSFVGAVDIPSEVG